MNDVQIFFSGDDPLDRELVHIIAKDVSTYGTPHLQDVDALDRLDDLEEGLPEKAKRTERFPGAPIFVLSRSMLAKLHNRRKLIRAVPALGIVSGYFAFFICRGITYSELENEYPDLKELFRKVMIGNESDLPELLAELREYVPNREERTQQVRFFSGLTYYLSSILLNLSTVAISLYYLSFLAPLILFYYLIISPPTDPRWELAFSFLALYGAGYGCNILVALDFWPWLGSKWQLPKSEVPLDLDRGASLEIADEWLTQRSLHWLDFGFYDPICSESELKLAVAAWLSTAQQLQLSKAISLLVLILPAAAVITHHGWPIIAWAGIACVIGLLYPLIFYWATDLIRRRAYRILGLTRAELDRVDKLFTRSTRLMAFVLRSRKRIGPEERDWYQIQNWILRQTMDSSILRHRWFQQPDSIFISYAWADGTSVPTMLVKTLEKLNVSCFLDIRDIKSRFAAWRLELSLGLLDCTHHFVVIGPKVLDGGIVFDEIKMSLQRWLVELFPAIICVVDPGIASSLKWNSELPYELNFLLTWCPQLSYEEASDPDIVAHLLEQRRRQGLLNDWGTVLFPKSALSQMLFGERRMHY